MTKEKFKHDSAANRQTPNTLQRKTTAEPAAV
jgi:hypothetical protein